MPALSVRQLTAGVVLWSLCQSVISPSAHAVELGQQIKRSGDEIMVCGQLFHTTAPVILWTDPNGYDAYRVERRFSDLDKAAWEISAKEQPALDSPNRYGIRKDRLTDQQLQQIRGGGWSLPLLKEVVDQFVMHYDVCGVSRQCFKVLHDRRGLSVHFMLDIDGTIYQTLDLKERAWHATISNSRSIGVEIASIGAYPTDAEGVLDQWYFPADDGGTLLRPPRTLGHLGLRTVPFHGRPDRPTAVVGTIQGVELTQYDFTPEQYDSLIKLTATLCRIFPRLKCEYPRCTGSA